MSYNDCRHGAEMCDTCLDIMSDGIKQGAEEERRRVLEILDARYPANTNFAYIYSLIKEDNK
jgi:hypothetical protein